MRRKANDSYRGTIVVGVHRESRRMAGIFMAGLGRRSVHLSLSATAPRLHKRSG
jgi:hypothetical protein